MLTVVRSPEPCLPLGGESWPEVGRELLRNLADRPECCHWIVPDEARRKFVAATWAADRDTFLPHLHTFESFTRRLAGCRGDSRPVICPVERLVRLDQAWHAVRETSAGVGLLPHLDRFVRDWQLCVLPPPARPADDFEAVVHRYLRDLETDGVHDAFTALSAVLPQLATMPLPALERAALILLDGFQRLEPLHLRWIMELSRRYEVLLWLPGVEKQVSGELASECLAMLRRRRVDMRVVEHPPASTKPIAALGRRLFPTGAPSPAAAEAVPGILRIEADSRRDEVEVVAGRIRADLRGPNPPQPREVAVIAPDAGYRGLVEEIFPRHGLPVDGSEGETVLASTRPARVLAAAWEVFRSRWRYEVLRDFLLMPAVRRRLPAAPRLDAWFAHRPRSRRQRSAQTWFEAWERLLQRDAERLAGWEERSQPLPEGVDLDVKRAGHGELRGLLDALQAVLQPVTAMEAAVASQGGRTTALRELAEACLAFLDTIALVDWLQGMDRDAYVCLVETLRGLASSRVPFRSLWQPNALDTLRGVLETRTISGPTGSADGISVLTSETSVARRFRHLYFLDLQDGVVPNLVELQGTSAPRLRVPALRQQLRQKKAELASRFASWFECATERIVLCRPTGASDDAARPSSFLRAVTSIAHVPELPRASFVSCLREAGRRVGEAVSSNPEGTLSQVWPAAAGDPGMESLAGRVAAWRRRAGWPRRNHVQAGPLLRLHFRDDRPFSPSDLETYAACPFRYFGGGVLGLAERDADPARINYGSLIHSVLQRFYDDLRRDLGIGANEPLPPITAEHREQLTWYFEQEWQKLGDGAVPPDLRTLFVSEQGVLQLFLDMMARVEAEQGNLRHEFALKNVLLGEDEAGHAVRLGGRIDRVDVHRATSQAIIIDYKTGKGMPAAERRQKTDDGRLLQLPLYAAALARQEEGFTVVAGAYLHLSEREAKLERAIEALGEVAWETGKPGEVPFDPEAARHKALELAGRMRAGDFSLTPHTEGRLSECTSFCPLRHACRAPAGYKVIHR